MAIASPTSSAKTDVKLAPVQAYQAFWATPVAKNPDDIPRETKQDFVHHGGRCPANSAKRECSRSTIRLSFLR